MTRQSIWMVVALLMGMHSSAGWAYRTATLEEAERLWVSLTAGAIHTCALDDSGVKCWGDNRWDQTNVPPLSHPTQIVAGVTHTCRRSGISSTIAAKTSIV